MLWYEVGRHLWRSSNPSRPLAAGSAQAGSGWALNISLSPVADAPVPQSPPRSSAGPAPVSPSASWTGGAQSRAQRSRCGPTSAEQRRSIASVTRRHRSSRRRPGCPPPSSSKPRKLYRLQLDAVGCTVSELKKMIIGKS